MDSLTILAAASALTSFAVAAVLVLTSHHHGRFSMDEPGAVQKFHLRPTPRIGGVGIYLALLTAQGLIDDPTARSILKTILVAGTPAFLMGLLEDLTKGISVAARLAATMFSGIAACWLSGVALNRLEIPGIDALLTITPLAVLFTAFAIGGLANANNIIDGFHGLASGTTSICLLALAMVAAAVGDAPLVLAAVSTAAAVVGFWLINFPWGKLFLGDGGAYFSGFALAWLAVLLAMRNPGVSPWACLVICLYPIVEVVYSMARRILGRQATGRPDRRHLHSLVATHIVQRRLTRLSPTLQNACVSVIMWACAAIPAGAAIAVYNRTDLLVASAVACILAYHLIYRQVAKP